MKSLWTLVVVALLFWCSPLLAEYCSAEAEGKSRSCVYKIDRIPHSSQIVISYTRQGWTMMIVVFREEFAMIEGDSTVKSKKGGTQDIQYVKTLHDMTRDGRMMEAAIYLVSEEVLHNLANSSGKVRFFLAATEVKKNVVEVEVTASQFEDVEDYITETKTVLAALFKDK